MNHNELISKDEYIYAILSENGKKKIFDKIRHYYDLRVLDEIDFRYLLSMNDEKGFFDKLSELTKKEI